MVLYIDYMNFIIEYLNDGLASDYWMERHALIDHTDLEKSHEDYLEVVRRWFPTYSDKLTTIDMFKERIAQFYERKEKGKYYYLDLVHTGTKMTLNDKTNKLRINTHKTKVKNVGTQLNLNLFD